MTLAFIIMRQQTPAKKQLSRNLYNSFNNTNSQLEAITTNIIDNYNKLNMFRAIISPILRSTRLCLQLVE